MWQTVGMLQKALFASGRCTRCCTAVSLLAILITAQAQGHKQSPGFTYAISTKPDPYGLYSVTIKNTSRLEITAIHAFSTCGDGESNSVGSDSLMQFFFLRSKSMALSGPSLLAPGESSDMDMPLTASGCRQAVSILFSDGHGEGEEDTSYGWRQMIADRYSTYAELLRTRDIVEGMSDSDAHFSETLLHSLESRRMALNDRTLRDVPKSEVASRSHVMDTLLSNMRDPHRMTDDLKGRDSALKLLDSWMKPLSQHGYDKPAS
jgi:hypothetical protein